MKKLYRFITRRFVSKIGLIWTGVVEQEALAP
jgi:hypothetical protein